MCVSHCVTVTIRKSAFFPPSMLVWLPQERERERDFRQVISLWHICLAPRALLCLQLCLVHHLAEQIRAQTDCLQPNQYVKFCTAEFVMGHHGISIRLILYQTHISLIYLGLLDRIYTIPAFFVHFGIWYRSLQWWKHEKSWQCNANRGLFGNNQEIVPTFQSSKREYLQNISCNKTLTTMQVGNWKSLGSPCDWITVSAPVAGLIGVG